MRIFILLKAMFEISDFQAKFLSFLELHSKSTPREWRTVSSCHFSKTHYTWSVRKVSRILNSRELRIFDFRFFCGVMLVLISHTCADKFGHFECSINFRQLFSLDVIRFVFDFCLFSFGNKTKSRGTDLGNTVAAATLLCCFWPKISAQATMCEQGRYRGARANFCSPTNQGFSGALLRANCA